MELLNRSKLPVTTVSGTMREFRVRRQSRRKYKRNLSRTFRSREREESITRGSRDGRRARKKNHLVKVQAHRFSLFAVVECVANMEEPRRDQPEFSCKKRGPDRVGFCDRPKEEGGSGFMIT